VQPGGETLPLFKWNTGMPHKKRRLFQALWRATLAAAKLLLSVLFNVVVQLLVVVIYMAIITHR
jgi:hypothetical protein